jgi:hypothetical protein
VGATLHVLRTLLKVPRWALGQPREFWLTRQAVGRIRAQSGAPVTPKLVVFVSESAGSRLCKIGCGLRGLGWRVVLIHRRDLPPNAGRYFDETRRYATPAEALLLATEYRPVAYHVFANWNFNAAARLIRHRPGRIVFDDYDVLVGTLRPNIARGYLREIRLERFCLENADGHCCRDLEMQCAKRAGYRLRGRRLLITDCCWGDAPGARPPRAEPVDGFHVVNCGNVMVATEREYSVHRKELIALAARLRVQGLSAASLHFHVYSTSGIWSRAPRSASLDEATATWLHLHEPVAPDELQAVLMRYDAGLYHVGIGDDPPTYNRWKFVYTSGNRVFDYLDAELPVIIHGSTFMEFLVRRAGADIRVESSPLREAARRFLRREDTASLPRRAAAGRTMFAIARHAPRLAAFYESL